MTAPQSAMSSFGGLSDEDLATLSAASAGGQGGHDALPAASMDSLAVVLEEDGAFMHEHSHFLEQCEHDELLDHSRIHGKPVIMRRDSESGKDRVVAAKIEQLLESVIDPKYKTSGADMAAVVAGNSLFFESSDFLGMILREYSRVALVIENKGSVPEEDAAAAHTHAHKNKKKVSPERALKNALTRRERLLKLLKIWLTMLPGDFQGDTTSVGLGLFRASLESGGDQVEKEWLVKLREAEQLAFTGKELVQSSRSVQAIVNVSSGDLRAAAKSEERAQSRAIASRGGHNHKSKKKSKFGGRSWTMAVRRLAKGEGVRDLEGDSGVLMSPMLLSPRVSPAQVACQLTVLDYMLMERLTIRELVRESWRISPSPALIALRDHFQRFVLFIATEILAVSDTHERTEKLSRVIFIAEALLKLNNLHSAFAFHRALRLPCIDRLNKTWKHVHPDAHQVYARLETLFNFEWDGGAAYRKHVEKCLKSKKAMIPAYWAQMDDVSDALNARSVLHRDTSLISFASLSVIYRITERQRSMLRRRYSISIDEDIQEVLREGLSVDPYDELARKSSELEPPKEVSGATDGGARAQQWYLGSATREQVEQVFSMVKRDSFVVREFFKDTLSERTYIVSTTRSKRILHFLVTGDESKLSVDGLVSEEDEEGVGSGKPLAASGHANLYARTRKYGDIFDLIASDAIVYGLEPAQCEFAKYVKQELHLPIPPPTEGRDLRLSLGGFNKGLLNHSRAMHRFLWEDVFLRDDERRDAAGFFAVSEESKPKEKGGRLSPRDRAKVLAQAAVDEERIADVISMVESGQLPANSVLDSQQRTLLHVAAEFNEPHFIDLLMWQPTQPSPPIDARDASTSTALHVACRGGFTVCAVALLDKGASVNVLTSTGASPLHYAVRKVPEDPLDAAVLVGHLLRSGALIDAFDVDWHTPLFHAVMSANVEGVRVLLNAGANPDCRNRRGLTCEDLLKELSADRSKASSWHDIQELLEEAHAQGSKVPDSRSSSSLLDGNNDATSALDRLTSSAPLMPARRSGDSRRTAIVAPSLRFRVDPGVGRDLHCDLSDFLDARVTTTAAGLDPKCHLALRLPPVCSHFMANDAKRGTLWLTLSPSEQSSSIAAVVRCRHGNSAYELPYKTPADVLLRQVASAAGYSFVEHKDETDASGQFDKIVYDADASLVNDKLTVPVLFVPFDGFRPRDMLRVSGKEVSSSFESFLDSLGGTRKSSGELETTLKNVQMTFLPLPALDIDDRASTLQKHPLVVVFTDTAQVDSKIFESLPASLILFVRPSPLGADRPDAFSLNLLTAHGVRRYPYPMLPFGSSLATNGAHTREYLLTTVYALSVCGFGAAPPFSSQHSKQRERALSKLYTALQMLERSAVRPEESSESSPVQAKTGKPNDYLLGKQLGAGATGRAFTALHKETRQKYCMKIVDLDALRNDKETLRQVQLEVEILSKVQHDNIVRLFESYETPDSLFLVEQLCTGGDLEAWINKDGELSEERAKPLARQLVSAVAILRRYEVSHRDLKPENLMFADPSHDTLIIVDFGLGKDTSRHAMNHTIAGTPDYIAPEILEGEGYDYFKIDDYSAGCVVYFMLFGRAPFASFEPGAELFTAIMQGMLEFKHPSKNVALSGDAKDFVGGLMHVDPGKRMTAATALGHPWVA